MEKLCTRCEKEPAVGGGQYGERCRAYMRSESRLSRRTDNEKNDEARNGPIYTKQWAFREENRGLSIAEVRVLWQNTTGGPWLTPKQILSQSYESNPTKNASAAKPTVSAEDRIRFQSLFGPVIRQSEDADSQERNKPQGPRQAQTIWLTDLEENAAVVANNWKCFGCGCEYGTYIHVGGIRYEAVLPEQMHVTKTRKAGGTKEDVRVGCYVCNTVHGLGEGMSDSAFKAMIQAEWVKMGYRNVKRLIEAA